MNNTLGSISPAHAETGSNGRATVDFRYGIRSGDVNVTARMALNESQNDNATLHIDHATTPYQINETWYSPKVTAGGEAKIIVRMEDQYGNVVDSKREIDLNIPSNKIDNATFMVGSPGGDAKFDNGEDKITVPVDENGNATATLRVDRVAGENIVYIQPPALVWGEYISILGVANGEPCTIKVDVLSDVLPDEENPPRVYAGSNNKFILTYTLRDEFGNPSPGKVLEITTNMGDGEGTSVKTNAYGKAQISYGPWVKPGSVTITATAVENCSVTHSQPLAFVVSKPTKLFLSANPETMPSRDVPGCEQAEIEIRAKLVDQYNNPILEKEVWFEIQDIDNGTYDQTTPPLLSGERATTNAHGIASVEFTPGAFTTEYQAPGYSPAATGTCDVVATWDGIERPVNLTWMNYPYLSVETNVTPETVTVSDTVDVTIRLRGDGWAMKPNPIDVILCVDRAETMVSGYPDHMVTVMEAAPIFIDHMIPGWDRIGLLSFGYNGTASVNPKDSNKELTISKIQDIGIDNHMDDVDATLVYYPGTGDHRNHYAGHATLDVPLPKDSSPATNNFGDVRTGISTLIPGGGNPVRKALYEGITELKGNGRSKALKALVFLIDGDYDWYGDPLARAATNKSDKDPEQFGQRTNNWYPFGLSGGEENMAVYARNNDVRIYTITFSSAVSDNCNETMQTLATGSGGSTMSHRRRPTLPTSTGRSPATSRPSSVNTAVDIAFESVGEQRSAPVSRSSTTSPSPGFPPTFLTRPGPTSSMMILSTRSTTGKGTDNFTSRSAPSASTRPGRRPSGSGSSLRARSASLGTVRPSPSTTTTGCRCPGSTSRRLVRRTPPWTPGRSTSPTSTARPRPPGSSPSPGT